MKSIARDEVALQWTTNVAKAVIDGDDRPLMTTAGVVTNTTYPFVYPTTSIPDCLIFYANFELFLYCLIFYAYLSYNSSLSTVIY